MKKVVASLKKKYIAANCYFDRIFWKKYFQSGFFWKKYVIILEDHNECMIRNKDECQNVSNYVKRFKSLYSGSSARHWYEPNLKPENRKCSSDFGSLRSIIKWNTKHDSIELISQQSPWWTKQPINYCKHCRRIGRLSWKTAVKVPSIRHCPRTKFAPNSDRIRFCRRQEHWDDESTRRKCVQSRAHSLRISRCSEKCSPAGHIRRIRRGLFII